MSTEALLTYKKDIIANLGVVSQFRDPDREIERDIDKIEGDMECISSDAKVKLIALASYGVGVLDGKDDIEYQLHKEALDSIISEVSEIIDNFCGEAMKYGKRAMLSNILENENIEVELC